MGDQQPLSSLSSKGPASAAGLLSRFPISSAIAQSVGSIRLADVDDGIASSYENVGRSDGVGNPFPRLSPVRADVLIRLPELSLSMCCSD